MRCGKVSGARLRCLLATELAVGGGHHVGAAANSTPGHLSRVPGGVEAPPRSPLGLAPSPAAFGTHRALCCHYLEFGSTDPVVSQACAIVGVLDPGWFPNGLLDGMTATRPGSRGPIQHPDRRFGFGLRTSCARVAPLAAIGHYFR